jgi:hypothetical protein
MFGLVMIMLGTISLIISVSPSPGYPCLLDGSICDAIGMGYQQYQQYEVRNFIIYFLLGSILMTLSVIILFLGRTKTKETHPTAGIEGYRPWFDNDS